MSEMEKFRCLGLSEAIVEALKIKGFTVPTPIQEQTIPKLLSGEEDLIGQAQTGTGKTAAFGLPILQCCKAKAKKPQALILSPTRELSIQIAAEMHSFNINTALRVLPFYGGQSIEIQLRKLQDGVDVAIGTPGRIMDLIRRGKLDLSELKFAVLDEADEMLDMGFLEDIETILAETNPDKRMLMFSATMPKDILKIAENFMRTYEIVRTISEKDTNELTEQIFYEVRREDKLDALMRIIDMEEGLYALIFCRTRSDSDELAEQLKQKGIRAEVIHGDIVQEQRTKVISQFKAKKFKLLVATDVAARGIDINDLTHVINYSIPQETETYIHRIGRTGRAGKKGIAITFVTPGEVRRLASIRKDTNMRIDKRKLPNGQDVVERKKQRFALQLTETLAENKHTKNLNFAEELLTLGNSPAEVLAGLIQMHFGSGLSVEEYSQLGENGQSRGRRDKELKGTSRLHINVGKHDGYGVVRILSLIHEKVRLKKFQIGKIDCLDRFSFIDIDANEAERVVKAFANSKPSIRYAKELPNDERDGEFNNNNDYYNKKRKDRTPAPEKKRRLNKWVESISAEIDSKEKRKKRKKS